MIASTPPTRPKVCHIIHDGSGQGGGATFSLAYFPAYKADFETLAITGRDGDLAGRLREHGVRTLTLPMERPWRALLSWPRLWNILRRERPDAVIVHGQWGGFFGALAARAIGCPVILYYTQFPSFYADWDLVRVIRNRVAESVTCACATRVVCLSAAGRYQYLLRRLTPETKLLHLPNAVDPANLMERLDRAALRAELNPPAAENDPVVVSVGRLAYQKRIDLLLHAWALVESRTPRGRLVIVGVGPEEETLRRLAAELQLRRCDFLGYRSHGYRYFQAADFGVICSLFEGQPLALIEAMFLSCPMIGTRVDGIGETIVNQVTGLLVPPADAPALAGAILDLLADPARARQMGEAGRLRAEELYRLDKLLPRQIQLVKDELKSAGKSARQD
jgi:glycosyltransferase involved in cell wall biosynthesis